MVAAWAGLSRTERIHPPVQHLRETGEFGYVLHRDAGIADGLGGTAGGEEFHALVSEGTGEIEESGLVGDGEKCAFDHDGKGIGVRGEV